MGQVFLQGSAGQSLLEVSHELAVRRWLGLESPEGSTGTDVVDDSPDKAGSQRRLVAGSSARAAERWAHTGLLRRSSSEQLDS